MANRAVTRMGGKGARAITNWRPGVGARARRTGRPHDSVLHDAGADRSGGGDTWPNRVLRPQASAATCCHQAVASAGVVAGASPRAARSRESPKARRVIGAVGRICRVGCRGERSTNGRNGSSPGSCQCDGSSLARNSATVLGGRGRARYERSDSHHFAASSGQHGAADDRGDCAAGCGSFARARRGAARTDQSRGARCARAGGGGAARGFGESGAETENRQWRCGRGGATE